MSKLDYEIPKVERVGVDHGTHRSEHIEPPLAETVGNLDALRWKAAVCELDAGIAPGSIRVIESDYSVGGVRRFGYFDIMAGRSSIGPLDFHGAWEFINGLGVGVRMNAQATA